MPYALNCTVAPTVRTGLVGVIAIDVNTMGTLTFKTTGALEMPAALATILVDPGATPVARPPDDVMVAVLASEDVQAADEVTSCVVPFL